MEKLDCMAEQIINFGARANAALDKIGTAVDGVAADVAGLKAKIEELQNSPGAITPEDQKILDDIEARVNTLADHVTVLDEATPNVPPPVEGEVPPV